MVISDWWLVVSDSQAASPLVDKNHLNFKVRDSYYHEVMTLTTSH